MIRPARRGGPPPFQVMSNTWRDEGTPGAAHRPIDKPAEKPQAAISPRPPAGKPRAAGPSLPSRFVTLVASSLAAVVDGASRAGGHISSRCNRWLSGTVGHSPLSRKYVAIGLLAFVALVVVIATLGGGGKAGSPAGGGDPVAAAPGEVDANLLALQATQPGAVPQARAAAPGAGNPRDSAKAGPGTPPPGTLPGARGAANATPALVKGKADPREKGNRYYVLATYSVTKEELMLPMLAYLWSQGVEAGAFNAHNSRLFQVIALQGFTKEEINQGAQRKYEDALRRIGRKWKSDGGGDDLHGLYLEEFKGAPVNLSITKANRP